MLCELCMGILSWVMLVYILYRLTLPLYNVVYVYLIAKPMNLLSIAGGKWAVVTGSTDGIGKAYALELAHQGFSIVLIGKRNAALEDMMREITSKTNVQVKAILFDFTCTDTGEYEKTIFSVLNELDIGVLVNNAGISYAFPELLHKVEGGLELLSSISIVNTLPCTLLTAQVIKQMVHRNSGIIVNVSSVSAIFDAKMLSVYSASKRFVRSFTACIAKEYEDKNIVFQCLTPGLVATKMTKIKPSLLAPPPEVFVKSAIRTVGITRETSGFFLHQIQEELIKILPDTLTSYYLGGQMVAMNRRAIAKKNKTN